MKNARPQTAETSALDKRNDSQISDLFPESLSPAVSATRLTPPIVSGQCAQVLNLIRRHQPFLSFRGTADFVIPEFAARVHDLRAAGWNIVTTIQASVTFRGVERRNVAFYSLGTPEWPRPGFNAEV